MSHRVVIDANGLGKRYSLGGPRRSEASIGGWIRHRFDASRARTSREFWALRDVNFQIRRGENVGLIGLNGAGKSTLLKMLSRITRPTTGRIVVDGRLGALLEVGTGFHGDLTGRENVFLYGSVLGMSRKEVRQKFDAIVEFSGTGAFIDTPVKRYSSGMYVRLAFAVAAHLDPDVLLLDEVLAVGDLPFQRKCLGFAKSLQQRDATVLFVSHNMFSIKAMCERAFYLRKGQIVFDGPTSDAIKLYEDDCRLEPDLMGTKDVRVRITACELLDSTDQRRTLFQYGESMRVRIRYDVLDSLAAPNFIVAIVRSDGVACANFSSHDDGVRPGDVPPTGELMLETPPIRLVAEQYNVFVLVRLDGLGDLVGSYGPVPFHVAHEVYDTHFGVYHEPGHWEIVDRRSKTALRTGAKAGAISE
jgi:lipopolysaccharide transport system ATP-binding protein